MRRFLLLGDGGREGPLDVEGVVAAVGGNDVELRAWMLKARSGDAYWLSPTKKVFALLEPAEAEDRRRGWLWAQEQIRALEPLLVCSSCGERYLFAIPDVCWKCQALLAIPPGGIDGVRPNASEEVSP